MSQPELLNKVVRALEEAGIGYMVTGSIASSLQGLPRATHDIDFVVDIEADALPRLAAAFPPPAFHFDEQAAAGAIGKGEMFNLIEVESGINIDFWPLTDEPFDHSRFRRRLTEEIMGMPVRVSSPEDTILMKLRWAKMSGGSEKQFVDALSIYEIQSGRLDSRYLEEWAERLGISQQLTQLKEQTQV